jgi:hypothetical protein
MEIELRNSKSKYQPRFIRIIVVSALLISSQGIFHSPKAEANVFSDISLVVIGNIAFDLGKNACGYKCAAAATATTALVNRYVPVVSQSAIEYAKPGLFEMFTNWGSTFFRP